MRQSRRRKDIYHLRDRGRTPAVGVAYIRYIASDAWLYSTARLAEIGSAGGLCRICARGAPQVVITVHHRSYANLGRERPGDLTTLCLDCHDAVTDLLRRRALAAIALPAPMDHPVRPPAVLVDSLHGRRAP